MVMQVPAPEHRELGGAAKYIFHGQTMNLKAAVELPPKGTSGTKQRDKAKVKFRGSLTRRVNCFTAKQSRLDSISLCFLCLFVADSTAVSRFKQTTGGDEDEPLNRSAPFWERRHLCRLLPRLICLQDAGAPRFMGRRICVHPWFTPAPSARQHRQNISSPARERFLHSSFESARRVG